MNYFMNKINKLLRTWLLTSSVAENVPKKPRPDVSTRTRPSVYTATT